MFLFVILLLPSALFPQDYVCEETCEYPIIYPNQTLTVNFGGSCDITVTIKKSECPDGSITIRVLSIDSFNYALCGNPGPGVLMIQAMHALIQNNSLGLGAGSHRYVYPSCWKYNETFTIVTPCYPNECCEIKIVYDSNCNRILPTRMSWNGIKYCFDPLVVGGCQNACISTDYEFEMDYRDLNGNN